MRTWRTTDHKEMPSTTLRLSLAPPSGFCQLPPETVEKTSVIPEEGANVDVVLRSLRGLGGWCPLSRARRRAFSITALRCLALDATPSSTPIGPSYRAAFAIAAPAKAGTCRRRPAMPSSPTRPTTGGRPTYAPWVAAPSPPPKRSSAARGSCITTLHNAIATSSAKAEYVRRRRKAEECAMAIAGHWYKTNIVPDKRPRHMAEDMAILAVACAWNMRSEKNTPMSAGRRGGGVTESARHASFGVDGQPTLLDALGRRPDKRSRR